MAEISPQRLLRLRVVGLAALAFLLMLTYSIARPAAEGLFLKAHGSRGLPLVWLLVTFGSVAVVALYNRYLGRTGLLRLYGAVSGLSGLLLAGLLVALHAGLPGALHGLYVWKDLYVVILVEIYYSYANSVFSIQAARWVYGLFGVLSSLGGMAGSLLVSLGAERFGVTVLLWSVPAQLVVIWLVCLPFARAAGEAPASEAARRSSLADGVRVVRRSRYLGLMLALVAAVQVAITLVDFEFNAVVDRTFPAEDQASAGIAKVYLAIAAVTLVLHALTGPVLRLAGVPLTLLVIPLLLGGSLGVYIALPLFVTIAVAKAASKCLDYSIFRAAKEILYIPLSYTERTAGKSVVDMVTYRVAKGGASLVLYGLVLLHAAGRLATPLTLAVIALWTVVTVAMVRRFRGLVSREQEMG